MTDPVIIEQVRKLTLAWRNSVILMETARRYGPLAVFGRREVEEQEAWNALIEFVESHDLNYSSFDPRPDLTEEEEGK